MVIFQTMLRHCKGNTFLHRKRKNGKGVKNEIIFKRRHDLENHTFGLKIG